ncbi:MAG: CarD family transcriptional regulator [Lachnospiraceae bacterium]|nr:CarD family transcriptional regulator [Lachnospiraceae bacterium]
MFEKGEYIVYGQSGVCQVEDITHLDISGVDKKKLYYVLVPLNTKGSRIYYPIDRDKQNVRPVITKEMAMQLLDEIPTIETIHVTVDKLREECYKKAIYSGDYRSWVSIIKTLYNRRQERLAQGKKMASVDERYLKMAQDSLYGELAFVFGKEKNEIEELIRQHIEERELEKA